MSKKNRWYWWQAIGAILNDLHYISDERSFFLTWMHDFPKQPQPQVVHAGGGDSYAEMSIPDPLDDSSDDDWN